MNDYFFFGHFIIIIIIVIKTPFIRLSLFFISHSLTLFPPSLMDLNFFSPLFFFSFIYTFFLPPPLSIKEMVIFIRKIINAVLTVLRKSSPLLRINRKKKKPREMLRFNKYQNGFFYLSKIKFFLKFFFINPDSKN